MLITQSSKILKAVDGSNRTFVFQCILFDVRKIELDA